MNQSFREQEDEDTDPTEGEELGVGDDESEEEGSGSEPETKRKNIYQASMGMSVLLPPGEGGESSGQAASAKRAVAQATIPPSL